MYWVHFSTCKDSFFSAPHFFRSSFSWHQLISPAHSLTRIIRLTRFTRFIRFTRITRITRFTWSTWITRLTRFFRRQWSSLTHPLTPSAMQAEMYLMISLESWWVDLFLLLFLFWLLEQTGAIYISIHYYILSKEVYEHSEKKDTENTKLTHCKRMLRENSQRIHTEKIQRTWEQPENIQRTRRELSENIQGTANENPENTRRTCRVHLNRVRERTENTLREHTQNTLREHSKNTLGVIPLSG